MKNNDFWKMAARGGILPEQFHFPEWKEAWLHAMAGLEQRIEQFQRKPCWERYDFIGQSCNRASSLVQVLSYMPLFLPKMGENERKNAQTDAVRDFETLMMKARDSVHQFLQTRSYKGDRTEQTKARREYVYWTGISPKRADCVRMENALQRDGRPLHLAQLSGMDDMPAMKRKLRQNAQGLGLMGYAIDSTDNDVSILWRTQPSESIRQCIWKGAQNGPVNQEEANELLQARKEWAMDGGHRNYIEHLDRLNPGLSFYSVEKTLLQSMKRCAEPERQLRYARMKRGLTVGSWTPKDPDDVFLPWNEGYLNWEATFPSNYELSGREFPLKRVINVIIPDILRMGGWNTIGSPQRIGRGKKCLYLYRLHKDGKMGMVYFAPYPGQDVKDSNSYQAYAAMLRERWTNGTPTTPIVLVAQNFSLKNGYLEDLDQLTYMCHEFGHALHFLGMKGETFDEYSRLHNHLAELPSTLFEYLTKDPQLLQQWCNPKFKPGRKLSYWQNRMEKEDMQDYIENMERSYLDLVAHRLDDHDLLEQHRKLRKTAGMDDLHPSDQTAYTHFDRTESAALFCTYGIAHALTKTLIPSNIQAKKIVSELNFLIDHVLTSSSADFSNLWKKSYGMSLYDMYTQGAEALDKEHIKDSRKEIRKINRLTKFN